MAFPYASRRFQALKSLVLLHMCLSLGFSSARGQEHLSTGSVLKSVTVEWLFQPSPDGALILNAYSPSDTLVAVSIDLPVTQQNTPQGPKVEAFLDLTGFEGEGVVAFKKQILNDRDATVTQQIYAGVWSKLATLLSSGAAGDRVTTETTKVVFKEVSDELQTIYTHGRLRLTGGDARFPHLYEPVLIVDDTPAAFFAREVSVLLEWKPVTNRNSHKKGVRLRNLGEVDAELIAKPIRQGQTVWGQGFQGPDTLMVAKGREYVASFTFAPVLREVAEDAEPVDITVRYEDATTKKAFRVRLSGSVLPQKDLWSQVRRGAGDVWREVASVVRDKEMSFLLVMGLLALIAFGLLLWSWSRQDHLEQKARAAGSIQEASAETERQRGFKTWLLGLFSKHSFDSEAMREAIKNAQAGTKAMLDASSGASPSDNKQRIRQIHITLKKARKALLEDHVNKVFSNSLKKDSGLLQPAKEWLDKVDRALTEVEGWNKNSWDKAFAKGKLLPLFATLEKKWLDGREEALQQKAQAKPQTLTEHAEGLQHRIRVVLAEDAGDQQVQILKEAEQFLIQLANQLQMRSGDRNEKAREERRKRQELKQELETEQKKYGELQQEHEKQGQQLRMVEQELKDTKEEVDRQERMRKQAEERVLSLKRSVNEHLIDKLSAKELESQGVTQIATRLTETHQAKERKLNAKEGQLHSVLGTLHGAFPKHVKTYGQERELDEQALQGIRLGIDALKKENDDLAKAKKEAEDKKKNVFAHFKPLAYYVGDDVRKIALGEVSSEGINNFVDQVWVYALPEYIREFRKLITKLDRTFGELYEQVPSQSLFHKLFGDIWKGEKGNAGIERACKLLSKEKIAQTFGVTSILDLRDISRKQFYARFIQRRLMVEVNRIVRLGLIQQIPSEALSVSKVFVRDSIEGWVIAHAFYELRYVLRKHFHLELRTVELFKTRFDATKHKKAPADTNAIKVLFPEALKKVSELPPGVVYEIFSVGLYSEELGIDTQPYVLYKE